MRTIQLILLLVSNEIGLPIPCFVRHVLKRLAIAKNAGDWEHKFEHMVCSTCGKGLADSMILRR